MYGVCLWRLGDHSIAEEALQNALISADRSLDTVLAAQSIRGYLLQTAKHAAEDVARKQARDRKRDQVWANAQQLRAQGQASFSLEASEAQALEACLAGVARETREAMMLRYKQGTPWKELAVRFGLEVDAIRQRVNRALQDVRDCLAGKGVTS